MLQSIYVVHEVFTFAENPRLMLDCFSENRNAQRNNVELSIPPP